jgi:hypothetical protein
MLFDETAANLLPDGFGLDKHPVQVEHHGSDHAPPTARTDTLSSVLERLIAAGCIALGLAGVLNTDAAQLVVLVAAVALVAVVLASSRTAAATMWGVHASVLAGITDPWAGHCATDPARSVVRLVLLSQPRR